MQSFTYQMAIYFQYAVHCSPENIEWEEIVVNSAVLNAYQLNGICGIDSDRKTKMVFDTAWIVVILFGKFLSFANGQASN